MTRAGRAPANGRIAASRRPARPHRPGPAGSALPRAESPPSPAASSKRGTSAADPTLATHGQSFIGFGITRLLGFDLLPRIKQINRCKFYLPAAGVLGRYRRLRPALTNPIRWELIERNYDLIVKYATAIRLGTASTEVILRRFNSDVTHPAYAAMLEVGRAHRTIFIARYLRDRDLQREINAGLNVVENYNGSRHRGRVLTFRDVPTDIVVRLNISAHRRGLAPARVPAAWLAWARAEAGAREGLALPRGAAGSGAT